MSDPSPSSEIVSEDESSSLNTSNDTLSTSPPSLTGSASSVPFSRSAAKTYQQSLELWRQTLITEAVNPESSPDEPFSLSLAESLSLFDQEDLLLLSSNSRLSPRALTAVAQRAPKRRQFSVRAEQNNTIQHGSENFDEAKEPENDETFQSNKADSENKSAATWTKISSQPSQPNSVGNIGAIGSSAIPVTTNKNRRAVTIRTGTINLPEEELPPEPPTPTPPTNESSPGKPKILPKIFQNTHSRGASILSTLVQEQYKLVASLTTCLQAFIIPLKSENHSTLGSQEHKRLFGRFEKLAHFHKDFLQALQSSLQQWNNSNFTIIQRYHSFIPMFRTHLDYEENSAEQIYSLEVLKYNKAFDSFLKTLGKFPELIQHLKVPLDKIPIYDLFFQKLKFCLPAECSDLDYVGELEVFFENLSFSLQRAKSHSQNLSILLPLSDSICNYPENRGLIHGERKLLKDGKLTLLTPITSTNSPASHSETHHNYYSFRKEDQKYEKEDCLCFLFNDMILFVKEKSVLTKISGLLSKESNSSTSGSSSSSQTSSSQSTPSFFEKYLYVDQLFLSRTDLRDIKQKGGSMVEKDKEKEKDKERLGTIRGVAGSTIRAAAGGVGILNKKLCIELQERDGKRDSIKTMLLIFSSDHERMDWISQFSFAKTEVMKSKVFGISLTELVTGKTDQQIARAKERRREKHKENSKNQKSNHYDSDDDLSSGSESDSESSNDSRTEGNKETEKHKKQSKIERIESLLCVPYIIWECCNYLLENGLKVEGVFRLAGPVARVEMLARKFDLCANTTTVTLIKQKSESSSGSAGSRSTVHYGSNSDSKNNKSSSGSQKQNLPSFKNHNQSSGSQTADSRSGVARQKERERNANNLLNIQTTAYDHRKSITSRSSGRRVKIRMIASERDQENYKEIEIEIRGGVCVTEEIEEELKNGGAVAGAASGGGSGGVGEEYGVHTVASLLRRFLKELPNPLLTYEQYRSFIDIGRQLNENELTKSKNEKGPVTGSTNQNPFAPSSGGTSQNPKKKLRSKEELLLSLKSLLQQIPTIHQFVLVYLLDCLSQVIAYSSFNKMGVSNLAIIFSPTWLVTPPTATSAADLLANPFESIQESQYATKLVEMIIDNQGFLTSELRKKLRNKQHHIYKQIQKQQQQLKDKQQKLKESAQQLDASRKQRELLEKQKRTEFEEEILEKQLISPRASHSQPLSLPRTSSPNRTQPVRPNSPNRPLTLSQQQSSLGQPSQQQPSQQQPSQQQPSQQQPAQGQPPPQVYYSKLENRRKASVISLDTQALADAVFSLDP